MLSSNILEPKVCVLSTSTKTQQSSAFTLRDSKIPQVNSISRVTELLVPVEVIFSDFSTKQAQVLRDTGSRIELLIRSDLCLPTCLKLAKFPITIRTAD